MSAPVPNANYAPNGYEGVSPGHYRRREDNPEVRAPEEAIAALNEHPHLSDLRGLFKGLPKPEPLFSEPESEVMPPENGRVLRHDTRPPSATFVSPEATKIDPVSDAALIIRSFTYGEMVEFAEGLGIDPMIIHKWATQRDGR